MNSSDALREQIRELRRRYDRLRRGETAALRRARTAADVTLEPIYWRLRQPFPRGSADLAHVVLLFTQATQARPSSHPFSFGRFLHHQVGDSGSAALRFRKLLASADLDELTHRLRGLLRLACAGGAGVEWGNLGADILWFFHENDFVRRRWAQDFYAPIRDLEQPATESSTRSTEGTP